MDIVENGKISSLETLKKLHIFCAEMQARGECNICNEDCSKCCIYKAKELAKKDIRCNPEKTPNGYGWKCPTCQHYLPQNPHEYRNCPFCGQHLDWRTTFHINIPTRYSKYYKEI